MFLPENRSLLLGFLFFGLCFQLGSSFPQNVEFEIEVVSQNSTSGIQPRDDNDEDDTKRKVLGVGDIVVGALELDLKKVLNGAFSFVNRDVHKNVIKVIFGNKPPTTQSLEGESSPSTVKPKKNLTDSSGLVGSAAGPIFPDAPTTESTTEPSVAESGNEEEEDEESHDF